MYKTILKFISVSFMSLIMVPTAFALGGGGASSTEPGDSCEFASNGTAALKRSPGAPYSGNVTITDTGEVSQGSRIYSVIGIITQFGNDDCFVSVDTEFSSGNPNLFDNLRSQDLRSVCLQNLTIPQGCAGSDTVYMEVINGRDLQEIIPTVKTVEILASPLRNEF